MSGANSTSSRTNVAVAYALALDCAGGCYRECDHLDMG